MKTKSVSLGFLAATLFAGSALAQAEPPAGPPPALSPAGEHRPSREEILPRFDTNHDGKLDDTERGAARAEWQKHAAENGGGPGARGPSGGREGFRGRGGPESPRGGREFAGRDERQGGFHGGSRHHRHWRKMMRLRHWRRLHQRDAMLRHFERNGDRHLSEAERGDAGKAGAERRARFQAGRQQMLARFDANHDGKLDENERQGAHDAWQEFLRQRPVLAAPAAPAAK